MRSPITLTLLATLALPSIVLGVSTSPPLQAHLDRVRNHDAKIALKGPVRPAPNVKPPRAKRIAPASSRMIRKKRDPLAVPSNVPNGGVPSLGPDSSALWSNGASISTPPAPPIIPTTVPLKAVRTFIVDDAASPPPPEAKASSGHHHHHSEYVQRFPTPPASSQPPSPPFRPFTSAAPPPPPPPPTNIPAPPSTLLPPAGVTPPPSSATSSTDPAPASTPLPPIVVAVVNKPTPSDDALAVATTGAGDTPPPEYSPLKPHNGHHHHHDSGPAKRWIIIGTTIIQNDSPTVGLPPVGQNANYLDSNAVAATPTDTLVAPVFSPAPGYLVGAESPLALSTLETSTVSGASTLSRARKHRHPKVASTTAQPLKAVETTVPSVNRYPKNDTATRLALTAALLGANATRVTSPPVKNDTVRLSSALARGGVKTTILKPSTAVTSPKPENDTLASGLRRGGANTTVLKPLASAAYSSAPNPYIKNDTATRLGLTSALLQANASMATSQKNDTLPGSFNATQWSDKAKSAALAPSGVVTPAPSLAPTSLSNSPRPTKVSPSVEGRWVWESVIIQNGNSATDLPSPAQNVDLFSSGAPDLASPTATPTGQIFNPNVFIPMNAPAPMVAVMGHHASRRPARFAKPSSSASASASSASATSVSSSGSSSSLPSPFATASIAPVQGHPTQPPETIDLSVSNNVIPSDQSGITRLGPIQRRTAPVIVDDTGPLLHQAIAAGNRAALLQLREKRADTRRGQLDDLAGSMVRVRRLPLSEAYDPDPDAEDLMSN